MDALSERYLKTGGDPRNLADYGALEKEIARQLVARLASLMRGRSPQDRALFTALKTTLNSHIAGLKIGPVRTCCGPWPLAFDSAAGDRPSRREAAPQQGKAAHPRSPNAVSWVYIVSPESSPVSEDRSPSRAGVKARYAFILGMIFMLIISTLTIWRWQMLCPTDPREAQLQCIAGRSFLLTTPPGQFAPLFEEDIVVA